MTSIIQLIRKVTGILMVTCLALMVVMVFGNVVLRYGFNSSITISEELSRWLFVWMIFLGAALATADRKHLGSDFLLARLSPKWQRASVLLSTVLTLVLILMLAKGMWELFRISYTSQSVVMGVSMGWFFAAGLVFFVLAAPPVAAFIGRIMAGKVPQDELLQITESEEILHTSKEATK